MKWLLRLLRVTYVLLIAALPVAALANYAVTQGSGTNFGSVIIGGVHYAAQLICDATTANQCAAVNSSGALSVNAIGLAQGSTTSGQTGSLVMGAVTTNPPSYTTAQTSPLSLDPAGNVRVSDTAFPANIAPTDCSGTITSGGTAQNVIAAQTALHGFVIANIDAAAGGGELLWISFTGTAAASTAGSYELTPPSGTTSMPGSYQSPAGFGSNHALSIIGATTNHKFSCTWW